MIKKERNIDKKQNKVITKIIKIIRVLYYFLKKLEIKIKIFFCKNNKLDISIEASKRSILEAYKPKNLYNQKIEKFVYDEEDENILLSLIVPVYNEEKNLRKCLTSLVNQETDLKYEIIVINNASTDNSESIIREFESNSKINAVKLKVNKGGSVARNYGISISKGKWIGFIDSDDYVSASYIEKMLKTAMQNDSDIVKCGYYVEKNNIIIKENKPKENEINGKIGEQVLNYDGFIWDAIYKRSLWSNIRFPNEYWYEDIIIKLVILRSCHSFISISDCLYYYVINKNSTSKKQMTSSIVKSADQCFLIEYYLKKLEELNIENDSGLYLLLLHELGEILYYRIRNLEKEKREHIFIIACDILEKYKKSNEVNYNLKFEDKVMDNALIDKNYKLWELISQYRNYLRA